MNEQQSNLFKESDCEPLVKQEILERCEIKIEPPENENFSTAEGNSYDSVSNVKEENTEDRSSLDIGFVTVKCESSPVEVKEEYSEPLHDPFTPEINVDEDKKQNQWQMECLAGGDTSCAKGSVSVNDLFRHKDTQGTEQSCKSENIESGSEEECNECNCRPCECPEATSPQRGGLKVCFCTYCGFETPYNFIMKTHITKHKHNNEKPSSSSETAVRKSLSIYHLKKNSNCVYFSCSYCKFKTAYEEGLQRHLKLHKYSCTECKFKTRAAKLLKIHMRNHSGEKPFSCPRCMFKTAYCNSLKSHMTNCTGGEPSYFCSQCEYKTFDKKSLEYHERIHNDETNPLYSCDHCEYETIYETNLARHVKIHGIKSIKNEKGTAHEEDLSRYSFEPGRWRPIAPKPTNLHIEF